MKTLERYDLAIIGGGIIGVSSGIAALESNPNLRVVILEKESVFGVHASGRNSGVIHAGFYYSPESLKAKFCKEGNIQIKDFARKWEVPIRHTGKVVVTRNKLEVERLEILFQRGIENGINIELLSADKLSGIEPSAITSQKFIWSPTTAVLDSKNFLFKAIDHYHKLGGKVFLNSKVRIYESKGEVRISSNGVDINTDKVINAAGAYSDLLARQVGVGLDYSAIPFRGSYRKSEKRTGSLRLIYPVPHPVNPFLGVHTTLTTDGYLKIGPTAIFALSRENYGGLRGIKPTELLEILSSTVALARGSTHEVLGIMKEELPMLLKSQLVKEASVLSKDVSNQQNWVQTQNGIRSQLVKKNSGELVQDFVVEEHLNSLHFLNLVSPGWTCAMPFAKHFIREFLN